MTDQQRKAGFHRQKSAIAYIIESHLSPDNGDEARKVRRRRIVRSGLLDAMSKESLNETIKRLDSTIQKLDAHVSELSEATRAQLEFMHISIKALDTKLASKASQSSVDDVRTDIRSANEKLDKLVARVK